MPWRRSRRWRLGWSVGCVTSSNPTPLTLAPNPNPKPNPTQVRSELETVERRLTASAADVDEAQRTGMEKRVQAFAKELLQPYP